MSYASYFFWYKNTDIIFIYTYIWLKNAITRDKDLNLNLVFTFRNAGTMPRVHWLHILACSLYGKQNPFSQNKFIIPEQSIIPRCSCSVDIKEFKSHSCTHFYEACKLQLHNSENIHISNTFSVTSICINLSYLFSSCPHVHIIPVTLKHHPLGIPDELIRNSCWKYVIPTTFLFDLNSHIR